MRRVISASIVLMMSASSMGSAWAMSSTNNQSPHCRVVDGGKLPAESGGAVALCAAIERAVSARAPGVAYTVEVKVLSSSRLAATLTKDGHELPEQRFASMDRELTVSSIERFAESIADRVAKGLQ